jgi:hypothetical protein
MTEVEIMSSKLTRGEFVQGAIALPALAGLLASATEAAAAQQGHGSKTQYKYQDKPHNGQQCSTCTFFIPGKSASAEGTCKIVAGAISPHGWCIAYSKK